MTSGRLRFVVDASVGAKWFLPERDSDLARSLLVQRAAGQAQLIAPDLFPGEVANAVWKRCRLRQEINEVTAHEAMAELFAALPEMVPSDSLVNQAFELGMQFRHPIYDCIYVALALREGCPLVTADRPLAELFGPSTRHVMHLESLDLGG